MPCLNLPEILTEQDINANETANNLFQFCPIALAYSRLLYVKATGIEQWQNVLKLAL